MRIKSLGANKTEVRTNKIRLLISYETPVCYIDYMADPPIAYKSDTFHSITTSKHINQWLLDYGFDSKATSTIPQAFLNAILET